MISFGICASVEKSADAKAGGWDFVEENIQSLFKGTQPDAAYDGKARIAASARPVPAANCLLPGDLKITGPSVNRDALLAYLNNVLRRAGEVGCNLLVFGSGGARRVPDGWDQKRATEQIVEFGKMISPIAQKHGILILMEHLNTQECNIVTTLEEELDIVQRVDHPNFQALLDTYHLWMDDLPLAGVTPLLPYIKHVHVADREGRVPPGQSGKSDYRPVFAMLKHAGYAGGISVEAVGSGELGAAQGPKVLAFLKDQWARA